MVMHEMILYLLSRLMLFIVVVGSKRDAAASEGVMNTTSSVAAYSQHRSRINPSLSIVIKSSDATYHKSASDECVTKYHVIILSS